MLAPDRMKRLRNYYDERRSDRISQAWIRNCIGIRNKRTAHAGTTTEQRVYLIEGSGFEVSVGEMMRPGMRLGDMKRFRSAASIDVKRFAGSDVVNWAPRYGFVPADPRNSWEIRHSGERMIYRSRRGMPAVLALSMVARSAA